MSSLHMNDKMIEEGQEIKHSIAMVVVFISLGMLFGTLFFGYAAYRFSNDVWPPMGVEKIPLPILVFISMSVFLGSIFYIFFKSHYLKNNLKEARYFLSGAILMGTLYCLLQCYFWNMLKTSGLYISSGIFSSLIYAFTWIHAAHMLIAMALLFWVLFFVINQGRSVEKRLYVNHVGNFWHFLTGIWFLIFIFLFVL